MRLNKDVWVFGPALDFFAFVVPIIFAGILSLFVHSSTRDQGLAAISYWLFVGLMIDNGHVYGTMVPVLLDGIRSQRLGIRVWAIPCGVLAVSLALVLYSPALFSTIISYLAITHVTRQQMGWLKALENKDRGATRTELSIDRTFFWSTIFTSVYFWQADLSHVTRQYFTKGDMVFLWPAEFWGVVKWVHIIILMLFVASVVKRLLIDDSFAIGKFSFLAMNWIWYFCGLVVVSNPVFFWVTLIVCHGVSYHIHINGYWRRQFGGELPRWFLKVGLGTVGAYLIFIFMMSSAFSWFLMWAHFRPDIFLAVANVFLVSHYVFDGMIWRRAYRSTIS